MKIMMMMMMERVMMLSDDEDHRDSEDGSLASFAACDTTYRAVCGVRVGHAALVDGDLHPHRPLAGLRLLRHCQHGTASPGGTNQVRGF